MSVENINTIRYEKDRSFSQPDVVVQEEPLEIKIEGRSVAVIMRTPDREQDIELSIGFLCTEGVIEDISDVHAIAHVIDPSNPRYNTIDVILSSGVPAKRRHKADRQLFASSSCGICGKETQDRIFQRFDPIVNPIDPSIEVLRSLPEKLRAQQILFERTGGIHAAALCTAEGRLLVIREDVGRHNAVDKVIGWSLIHDIDCSQHILLVSGRVAFEIAQKALAVQLPVIAAIGAPSSLAVSFCHRAGIRLFGFLKPNRCNEYVP